MNRNERFMEEFEDEIVSKFRLSIRQTLTIESIHTADVCEETHLIVQVVDAVGKTHELDAGQIFDPETGDTEWLMDDLEGFGIDRATIKERLIKAKLFEEGDF